MPAFGQELVTVTYFAAPYPGGTFDPVPDEGSWMARADNTQAGIARIATRFPDAAGRLQGLAFSDPGFRELCEEYGLAHASLARFEAMPDAAVRPEVPDYHAVIAALESEIDRFLREARPGH